MTKQFNGTLLILLFLAASTTHAATLFWDEPAGGMFLNPNNWNPTAFPSAADTTIFAFDDDYSVELTSVHTVDELVLRSDGHVTFTPSTAFPNDRTFRANNVTLEDQNAALTIQPLPNLGIIWDVADKFESFGNVTISDGTQVRSARSVIGRAIGGAHLLIQGRTNFGLPTFWEAGIFEARRATIDIFDGAVLSTLNARVGNADVTVNGLGSRWNSNGLLEVGLESIGSVMNVRNGGRLSAQSIHIGPTGGPGGRISVVGGGPGLEATMYVSENVFLGNDTTADFAALSLGANSTAELLGTTKLWSQATFSMRDSAQLLANKIENNLGGEFDFGGGTLQVNRFEGNLMNQGGELAPGPDASLTTIIGDYDQESLGSLAIDVGGSIAGDSYDALNVTGNVDLQGQLKLALINNFVPAPNETFTVLTSNNLVGAFDNVLNGQRLESTDGNGSFLVNYGVGSAFDASQVVLSDFQLNAVGPDFNADGLADCVDVDALVAEIVAGSNNPVFDMTADGVVDRSDLDEWRSQAGAMNLASGNAYLTGDATLDGVVDGQDFIEWNLHKFTATPAWCSGDFTADGVVDGQDFIEWNLNKFTAADAGVTAVPEPASSLAWLLAAVAVTLVNRSRVSS